MPGASNITGGESLPHQRLAGAVVENKNASRPIGPGGILKSEGINRALSALPYPMPMYHHDAEIQGSLGQPLAFMFLHALLNQRLS